MIKFFRKIRQNLLSDSKTGEYFKYAIGEIILVVIGILIALSINNWNESRKLENKKQELILNLIDDFEENIEELKLIKENSDSLINNMTLFFKNGYYSNNQVSLDSLNKLSDSFFRPVLFLPSMTSYDEAKSNGNLSLLENKGLYKEFSKFQRQYITFSNLENQSIDSYFKGSVWELKKSLGSLGILFGDKSRTNRDPINFDSYIKLINTPLVTATLENQYTLCRNLNVHLKEMDSISNQIVKILTEMKK